MKSTNDTTVNKDNPTKEIKTVLLDDSLRLFLDYEIRSSWWASWIGWNWGQELSGRYMAWKVKRKYARYKLSKVWEQRCIDFHIANANIKSDV